jgi:hypothetical protein
MMTNKQTKISKNLNWIKFPPFPNGTGQVEVVEPHSYPIDHILAVHGKDYVNFIKTVNFTPIDDPEIPEGYPSVPNLRRASVSRVRALQPLILAPPIAMSVLWSPQQARPRGVSVHLSLRPAGSVQAPVEVDHRADGPLRVRSLHPHQL